MLLPLVKIHKRERERVVVVVYVKGLNLAAPSPLGVDKPVYDLSTCLR